MNMFSEKVYFFKKTKTSFFSPQQTLDRLHITKGIDFAAASVLSVSGNCSDSKMHSNGSIFVVQSSFSFKNVQHFVFFFLHIKYRLVSLF